MHLPAPGPIQAWKGEPVPATSNPSNTPLHNPPPINPIATGMPPPDGCLALCLTPEFCQLKGCVRVRNEAARIAAARAGRRRRAA